MEAFMREFISYTKKMLETDNIWNLEREFNDLREESVSHDLHCDIGRRPENMRKNRYRDILPFDETRVKLPELPKDPSSDYINANMVRGATGLHHSYIASQGPLRQTLGDFWRMLFAYNVKSIVMLCNERENDKPKCERYWPTKDDVPMKRIDVFDLSNDAEFLDSVGRLHAFKCEARRNAAKKSTKAPEQSQKSESDTEVIVALHFELELLSEVDKREAYTVRKIRATKVESVLQWNDCDRPRSDDSMYENLANEAENGEASDSFYENVQLGKMKHVPRRVDRPERREFVQYHYRHWADYAAADELDSILAMHSAFRRHQPSVKLPICVHCSAGCGRTGTVMFIDFVSTLVKLGLLDRYLLRKPAPSDGYDFERSALEFVRRIVLDFRKQRPASVQSFEQYCMCYKATCELFDKQLKLMSEHIYVNVSDLRGSKAELSEPSKAASDSLKVATPVLNPPSTSTSSSTSAKSDRLNKLVQHSSLNTNLDDIDTITCRNSSENTKVPDPTPVQEAKKEPNGSSTEPEAAQVDPSSAEKTDSASDVKRGRELLLDVEYQQQRQQPVRSRTPDPERRRGGSGQDFDSEKREKRVSKDDIYLLKNSGQKKAGVGLVRRFGEMKHPVKK